MNCFYICISKKSSEMNDRLKQFLAMESLSPARFAEIMGIQRSGVSHLLSGRNKPSFEFIEKMLAAYPDLNAEWLILGKGRPYKSDRPLPENTESPDLFSESEIESTAQEYDLSPDNQSDKSILPASQPSENRKIAATGTSPYVKSDRRIARIIVFFTDGTYEEK